jgi:hypothetical protein
LTNQNCGSIRRLRHPLVKSEMFSVALLFPMNKIKGMKNQL